MNETSYREKWVRPRLEKAGFLVDRFEDQNTPGVADLSITAPGFFAWLELKTWDLNPSRGLQQIPHFTPLQRRWLTRRGRLGINVGMLVLSRGSHLFFPLPALEQWSKPIRHLPHTSLPEEPSPRQWRGAFVRRTV